MNRNLIFSTILLLSGLIVGFAMAEALYRGWLAHHEPDRFKVSDSGHPDVWFFEKSRWTYNEAYGFEYGPEIVHGGSATGGLVRSCWTWPANARGNMGFIEGDYETADLKVLVFGDSFTAQVDAAYDPRGVTWPDYLQAYLTEGFEGTAHVVNFGRDGYGILQMVDLAADMVPVWEPDLVVFAYITDDLTRARSWRTYTIVDGRERILTTTVPDPDPPLMLSSDTAIVNSKATPEWCAKAVEAGASDDPVLAEMEESVRIARANQEGRASVWDFSHSFLMDRIVHRNAFHNLTIRARPSQNPRHALDSFSDDPRFSQGLERLKTSGIPMVVVHLATADELVLGSEYVFRSPQEEKLNDSLAEEFETQIQLTTGTPPPSDGGFPAIKRSPNDAHPSVAGMKFYARVVERAVSPLVTKIQEQ